MLKKITMILGGLFALLIIAALIAPFFISADSYKHQIIAKVEAETGRAMTIDGPISIRFFPFAGLTAEKVTLSNPQGFSDKVPFLALDKFKINVALVPLLGKRIVIKDFDLENPRINLHVTKNGVKNWVFTKAARQTAVEATKTPDASSPDSGPPIAGDLMLNNLSLTNGTILYINENDATANEIKEVNASIKLQSMAAAALIEGSAQWNGQSVAIKAGLGTLKSLLEKQKMEFNLTASNSLIAITANGIYEKGAVTGKSSIKSASLKDVAKWLQPGGKPLPGSGKLSLVAESDIRCGNSYCSLPNIRFALDALEGKGLVKISLADPKPAITMEMNVDNLDFNPFLPDSASSHASMPSLLVADAVAQSSGRWSESPIDLSFLKQINLNAKIKTKTLTYQKLAISDTTLVSTIQQGVMRASVANASLYSGKGSFSATADANASTYDMQVDLKDIQLEPFLKDAAGLTRLSGKGDVYMTLKSSGGNQKAIVSALNGNGHIKLDNGVIKGVNLTSMLHNVANAFSDGGSASQSTSFSDITGTFAIVQGVISNHDLSAHLEDLNVGGEGTVNLPAYSINYRLTPKLLATTQDKAGVKTSRESIAVPVLIEGSLDHPSFRPDLQATLQNALQDPQKFKEQLKDSRAILKEQAKNPKDAVKNLKGLLNGFR